MKTYQFEDEWSEDATNIEWQKVGRRKLNHLIHLFNEWQIKGCLQGDKQELLARLEHGVQTFGQQDGGSGWRDVICRMQQYVEQFEQE